VRQLKETSHELIFTTFHVGSNHHRSAQPQQGRAQPMVPPREENGRLARTLRRHHGDGKPSPTCKERTPPKKRTDSCHERRATNICQILSTTSGSWPRNKCATTHRNLKTQENLNTGIYATAEQKNARNSHGHNTVKNLCALDEIFIAGFKLAYDTALENVLAEICEVTREDYKISP
jgi:hypothetical protein